MSHIAASMLAGLGFFFFGLHLVGTYLKQASGRRFRSLIAQFTGRDSLASFVGLLAGAVMQSTNAVTVIVASMISGRIISIRQALPVVAWTNVGTTLLVFAAVIDFQLAVLYLVGIAALAFSFSREEFWRNTFGIALGIGLLLFGIGEMKTSAAGLLKFPWFDLIMAQARGSYLLAALCGMVLSFVTQSTTGLVVIVIAFAQGGMLHIDESMMLIYGGNVGSTFSRMLLSGGVQGAARQVGHFQDIFKLGALALFVVLFYIEILGGIPLVKALTDWLTNTDQTQLAIINLIFNVTMALLLMPFFGPMQRLLERCWPATEAEDFAGTKYLYPGALGDPESALDLLEKEQARLVGRLPDYLANLRTESVLRPCDLLATRQAFAALCREIESYTTALIDSRHSAEAAERLSHLQSRQRLIEYTEDAVGQFVTMLERPAQDPRLASLVRGFVEGLDFLLMATADAAASLTADDTELLVSLCGDRGELMGKIRKSYVESEAGLSPHDRSLLLSLTTLFERIVWLIGRVGCLLRNEAAALSAP